MPKMNFTQQTCIEQEFLRSSFQLYGNNTLLVQLGWVVLFAHNIHQSIHQTNRHSGGTFFRVKSVQWMKQYGHNVGGVWWYDSFVCAAFRFKIRRRETNVVGHVVRRVVVDFDFLHHVL